MQPDVEVSTLDKYEYKVRAEEIKSLIAQGEYVEAVKIADTIDWNRVKSVMMLCTISDLYKINRRFEESKELLLLAYERHPGGRTIVYSLCELSIKMEEYVQAIEYYKEFVQIAPRDSGRYILQYKLYEAQDVSLEERIAVLEEMKKRDYREKWAYELAYLYHRIGLATKCVEECDELILWFGEGKYVIKAMELKMLHQPLTPEQEKRYEMQMRGISMYNQEESEDEADSEETSDGEEQDAVLQAATTRISESELDDIHVKTLDMGQYNTINLQKELAASMKELLDDGTEVDESLEDESTDHITKSILAPMFENTEEMVEAAQEANNAAEQEPIEEEVFFEETGEMPEAEEFTDLAEEVSDEENYEAVGLEEYPAEIYEESESEADEDIEIEEISPELPEEAETVDLETAEAETEEAEEESDRITTDEITEVNIAKDTEKEKEEPDRAAAVMQQMRREAEEKAEPKAQAADFVNGTATYQILPEVPAPLAGMLSQEYDGQISLVVPEGEKVEKQITGQMSIEDILAEWERMKKDNEEKRKEDVRRRVQEQTGNLFAEFDESTKSGILAQLEELDEDAKEKEAEKPRITPHEAVEDETEELEEIEELEELEELVPEEVSEEAEAEEFSEEAIEDDGIEELEEIEPEINEAEEFADVQEANEADSAEYVAEEENIVENAKEAVEDITEGEIAQNADEAADAITEETGREAVGDKTADNRPQELSEAEMEDIVDERMALRQLTEEERELFGSFIHTRKSKEQFIKSIDNISLAAYTGNIIVTGDDRNDTMTLAKNLVREVQMTDSNFSGKVAKISGAALNKKDVETTLSRMEGGAVIIESAAKMTTETAEKLYKYLDHENKGIIVVLEGSRKEMNRFLKQNGTLKDYFTARFDIEALDDDALAAYGRKYAELMEYSIDELGMLALHTRISDMQTSTHVVNVAEVQEIVDDAIRHANRKNLRHFFDILLAKRYDEEDMIILRERDFN